MHHGPMESTTGGIAEIGDRMLKAHEVAEIMGVNERWVMRNSRKLPFRVAYSERKVVYSLKGLREWLTTRPR